MAGEVHGGSPAPWLHQEKPKVPFLIQCTEWAEVFVTSWQPCFLSLSQS